MRRITKVLRDLRATRGRVAFMVLALAAGQTALGSVLLMRGVLQREMTRNYLDTTPASATFDIGGVGVTSELLKQVRARPEVAQAERRATIMARWRANPSSDWSRALLFVFEGFDDQRVAKVGHEYGALVPKTGTVLVERSALRVIGVGVGDSIELTSGAGTSALLQIAGVVHDPGLAPAASEQAGYFYITPETLRLLGMPHRLNELRVLVADAPLDLETVESQVEKIAAWLETLGVVIHEVRVPPPGKHPHEAPSKGILLLLTVFACLTLMLAGVLAASLMSITMARQVRETAVMKTIGASAAQIRLVYVLMIGLIACVALCISVPITMMLGFAGIDSVAHLLNFDIASYTAPLWVYFFYVIAGLGLPFLAATPAIRRASRVPVQKALNDHGTAGRGKFRIDILIGLFGNRLLQAALRNAFRVPRRLVLTLGLLGVGGGLFIGALSVNDAWEEMIQQVYKTRHYDVEFGLAERVDASFVARSSYVDKVEVWGSVPVTLATESGLPLSRTYPDGSHGSFRLLAVPDPTRLIEFHQRSGRWLQSADTDAVVLNQMAAARLDEDPIGKNIDLVVMGKTTSWKVVGVVDEVAAPATAYVNQRSFVERTGQSLNRLRIATATNRDLTTTQATVSELQRELVGRGKKIVVALPIQVLFNAMAEHVVVLVRILLGLALLMAAVGVLALSSSMSTSVVERTREIGVLRTIGARPRQVRTLIVIEGLFVALVSIPVSLLIGTQVARWVGQVVGQLSFELPLSLNVSWIAAALWSVGILITSTVASLVPSNTACRRSVRDALSHL